MAATVRAGNLCDPPVSPTQIRTLTVLDAAESGLSVTTIAVLLGTSLPSASRIVQRLVRDGLVDRSPGPGSEHRLTVSADGAAVLAAVNRARVAPLRALIERLPTAGRRGVVTALEDLAGTARESDDLW